MRTLLRLLVIAAVAVVAGVLIYSYAGPRLRTRAPDASATAGTSGSFDSGRAREIGAELGEKTAAAGERVREGAHDAAITAKIKAKMALDELVRARAIDVSTDGSIVTLSGTVDTGAEHDRAVALAQETAGVTRVNDRLVLR